MKNLLKALIIISSIAPAALAAETSSLPPVQAVEQDKYDLTCDVGAVCFEQTLKNPKHSFHITAGSVVRVEVKAKTGASLTLVSGGNTMTASYLTVGTKEPAKQSVVLEATVDKTGDFTLDSQVAKVAVNGKLQDSSSDGYSLKITRTGMADTSVK